METIMDARFIMDAGGNEKEIDVDALKKVIEQELKRQGFDITSVALYKITERILKTVDDWNRFVVVQDEISEILKKAHPLDSNIRRFIKECILKNKAFVPVKNPEKGPLRERIRLPAKKFYSRKEIQGLKDRIIKVIQKYYSDDVVPERTIIKFIKNCA